MLVLETPGTTEEVVEGATTVVDSTGTVSNPDVVVTVVASGSVLEEPAALVLVSGTGSAVEVEVEVGAGTSTVVESTAGSLLLVTSSAWVVDVGLATAVTDVPG